MLPHRERLGFLGGGKHEVTLIRKKGHSPRHMGETTFIGVLIELNQRG